MTDSDGSLEGLTAESIPPAVGIGIARVLDLTSSREMDELKLSDEVGGRLTFSSRGRANALLLTSKASAINSSEMP